MADIPLSEPKQVTAGDTIKWRREDLAEYPASGGWGLSYALRNAAAQINLTATADGDAFGVTVAAATSATWAAGSYVWAAFVTKAGERYEVGRGQIDVRANLAAAGVYDGRTHAEKVLAAVEAVLEKRATKDQEELEIDGLSLKRTPLGDLIKLRERYRAEVAREVRQQNGGGSRRILTRFKGH